MIPKMFFFLVPLALLAASFLGVVLWDRRHGELRAIPGNGISEGALRSFYHLLWLLLTWSGICLSLPVLTSFRGRVAHALTASERTLLFGRAALLPIVLLFLLWYGGRQGYLRWISELSWPEKAER